MLTVTGYPPGVPVRSIGSVKRPEFSFTVIEVSPKLTSPVPGPKSVGFFSQEESTAAPNMLKNITLMYFMIVD